MDETPPDDRQAAVRHSWEQSGQPSVSLTQAVAAATDQALTELPPLHKSVDADALDALLARDGASSVAISFSYAGAEVVAHSSGDVDIYVN